jgi:hypothetical protein
MKITLKGQWDDQRIWLNGKELLPDKSLKHRNHSPDGFAWGYAGSGPSQLALAICLELYDTEKALTSYMDFKFKHLSSLPMADFEKEIEI